MNSCIAYTFMLYMIAIGQLDTLSKPYVLLFLLTIVFTFLASSYA